MTSDELGLIWKRTPTPELNKAAEVLEEEAFDHGYSLDLSGVSFLAFKAGWL